jgi:hypothetical protein
VLRSGKRLVAQTPEIAGDLIGQHLLKPKSEKVGSVAAVGARDDVAPETGCTAWSTVARGATVGQSRSDRNLSLNVPDSVASAWSCALRDGELALK